MLDADAERAFTEFFDKTESSAWIADVDGQFILANGAFVEAGGYNVEPLRVLPSELFLAFEERQTLARIGADLVSGAGGRSNPVLTLTSSRQNFSIRLIQRGDGRPPVLLGLAQLLPLTTPGQRSRMQDEYHCVQRAHARLTQLVESAPGALFEIRQAADGSCSLPYYSSKLPLLLGVSRHSLSEKGMRVLGALMPDDIGAFTDVLVEAKRDMLDFNHQFRVQHPQHGERWLMCSSVPAPEPGGGITWFGNLYDITERVQSRRAAEAANAALRAAHQRLSDIADNAPAGIFELHRDAEGNGALRYCSARLLDLFGFEDATPEGFFMRLRGRMRPRDFWDLLASMEESRTTREQWSHRFRYEHPSRGVLWLSGSATPQPNPDGSATWVGTIHDVTPDVEREEDMRRAKRLAEAMRARSEWQAFHDPLTGLANRRFFDKIMTERIEAARAAAEAHACTLIRIDGDRFKHVNDTLGHEFGDSVLRRIGQILLRVLSSGDLAARIGGDEFAVLMAPSAGSEDAEALCQHIREALEPVFEQGDRRWQIEVSHGIAHLPDLAADGSDILHFADAALYRAKERGRNRIELFTPELRTSILEDRQVAAELQGALERGEFVPVYQPQIDAATGALTGVETLLRWQHPTLGLLTPDRFLRVAEQMRMVPELDAVMLEKSRDVLKGWRNAGVIVPKIAFNVSGGRVRDPAILGSAAQIMEDGTRVAFELLESILLEEEDDVFRFHLDSLREAGVEIEIDDFGSGHASVIAVMAIAPDTLKIDRRLIAPLGKHPRQRKLIRAIIEIAESFGIDTVAEGVETTEQAELLRDLGCDVLQGYYFARPLGADALAEFALARQAALSATLTGAGGPQ